MLLLSCQNSKSDHRSWQVYKGGPDANNYSALDQVNKKNVHSLEVAWTFYPTDEPAGFQFWKYECNPIVVDEVMYITSAWRWLYALDAASGSQLWSFDPLENRRGGGVLRGVTYWEGEDGMKRIFVPVRNKVFSVDAQTGELVHDFGENGYIDLNITEGKNRDSLVRVSTPGIIYRDLLIIGGAVSERSGAAPGDVRAFDVRTGALIWTFHTIPWPGEFGHETWPAGSHLTAGGANNWAGMSLDLERGILYVPTGSPTYDYYGADRIGSNLFGNCLLAIDAATGAYIWHFQTVHHDIWDYDLPTAPNLVQVKKNGKLIDAVAQPSKMGFIYVLDRETGEPIFPVEERPVPASKMPKEEAWPTQPFPSLPKPFIRQSMTAKDLVQFSLESRQANQKTLESLWSEGLFTPPSEQGTLFLPGSRGGGEWGGGAYDVETGMLYINANESTEIGRLEKVRQDGYAKNETLYSAGRKFYRKNCAVCHGIDRQGIEINPALQDVGSRLSRTEMLDKIQTGAGIMPSFSSILPGHENEIIAFLTESGKDQPAIQSVKVQDSTTTFLNVTAHGYWLDSMDRPVIAPPWGTLTAINLHTGEHSWQIPLGNHPDLQRPGDPPTGTENYGGPVVTAGGLVFIASTIDRKFRAINKDNGNTLWEVELPGNGLATPSVYEVKGKQYIALAVSEGETFSHTKSSIIVFSLPN